MKKKKKHFQREKKKKHKIISAHRPYKRQIGDIYITHEILFYLHV